MRSGNNQLIESGTPKDEETRKVLPPPEDEGEYHYTNFPVDLDDLIEGSGSKNDSVDKHPGIRTPMELKQVTQAAKQYHKDDKLWPLCLKSYYYALYFLYLPYYAKTASSVNAAFRECIQVMERMELEHLGLPDEAPLRFLLMACLDHQKPMTAVRVFNAARRCLKSEINAATYGLYNKVLLDSSWPSNNRDGYSLWRLLRNVVFGVTAFMKPIQGYRQFQAPHPQAQLQLDMGEQKVKSVQGVQLVGCKTDDDDKEPETIFEPRENEAETPENKEKTVKRQSSIIKLSTEEEKDEEKEDEKLEEKLEERPSTPKSVAPSTPPRTPEPPVIPAYPNQSRSTWSLPKSMSGNSFG